MATKPEAQFICSVNKHIPPSVHHQSMDGTFTSGTPDQYYEGDIDHLWVEWKFSPSLPPVIDLTNQSQRAKLSKLQQTWLKRAYVNNQPCAVILGTPKGGYIYTHEQWLLPIRREVMANLLLSKKELAEWIQQQVAFISTTRRSHASELSKSLAR